MKKINLGKKLSLDKETIAKLNEQQMQNVQGGDSEIACTVSYNSCGGGCPTSVHYNALVAEVMPFGSCCKGSC
ncbi:class I lanthipeptide [Chitinophaga sp.]|uniref:class I lanthipeptide n=1 Tax=Chitinophaga sp. TaxID=1869181 RepID=UPI0031DA9927